MFIYISQEYIIILENNNFSISYARGSMNTNATLHCWSWVLADSEVVPAKAEVVSLTTDCV